MTCIISLNEDECQRSSLSGGKGAALAQLVSLGVSVPSGFVVTTDVFREYGRGRMPDAVAEEILRAFDALGCDVVAVRSSATVEDSKTASWAGELETYLNTTREMLIENIQKCWQSISSERANIYRMQNGIVEDDIAVAVVVQAMAQSDVSGVVFTVHPVTQDRDVMIIEACWGLGELLVGGMVTPDSYILRKSDLSIIDVMHSDQEEMMTRDGMVSVAIHHQTRRKLSDDQVQSLASKCIAIEGYYGFPCDIEWAIEGNELYILQSRPITT